MSGLRRVALTVGAVALLSTIGVIGSASPASAASHVFTINSLGDQSDATIANGLCATTANTCTLRAAIEEADSVPGDTYTFDFSVAGAITPATELDVISATTTIDGSTAPGYSVAGGPVVTVNGTGINDSGDCLAPAAPSITIRGLRLAQCSIGIVQEAGTHLKVVGNQIGTNGVAYDANSAVGEAMNLTADSDLIGGTTAADRNVISGFLAKGIRVQAGATNMVIEGNYIGTNAAGTAAIRNPDGTNTFNLDNQGLTPNDAIETASPSATITKNVIAGNPGYGIAVYLNANATISGNLIGVGADGTTPIYNTGFGISVQQGAHATIGGTAAGAGNVIATTHAVGNASFRYGDGIAVSGSTATIQGNWIGTNAAGATGLGNVTGILATSTITVEPAKDPSTATIGGTVAGAGNVIAGNLGYGIQADGSTATTPTTITVQGNTIGVTSADTVIPQGDGITVATLVGGTIGGTTAAAGNVISGQTRAGITVTGDQTPLAIEGNAIGTNAAGTAAIPNVTGIGVGFVGSGAGLTATTTIGGTAAGAGNLISGNSGDGIVASGPMLIEGNRIGTNATGTTALGNGGAGIKVAGAPTIGGAASGAGNLISGNGFNGISGNGADGYQVYGNTIGLNAAKTAFLPNTYAQIFASGNNATIGGPNAGQGNTIASGNAREGVQVNGTNNVVRGNLIHDTGGLTIDLAQHYPGGASNGDQLPPTLTTTTIGASSTAVSGTVTSDKAGPILVDVYASNVCQAHYGSGESKQYLGALSVPYVGGGVTTPFSGSVAKATVGTIVTATSTVPGNGTSQMSACQPISDLDVTEQHNFDQTVVGGDVGSLFTVTNHGPTATAPATLAFTVTNGPQSGNDVVTADTPSKGTVTLDQSSGTGTWAVPGLASGATATVCLRGDIVRATYVINVPPTGNITVPAAFGPQLDTNGSSVLDPYTGNNIVETYIPVGTTATAGATVCALPTITVADASVTRPASGTAPMSFAVHLSSAQTRSVTVHYATQNGKAVAVDDYVATSGDLTIPAGVTTGTITVPAVGSQSDEPDKAFTVLLSAPKHATLADATATGTVKANHILGGCPTGSTSVQRFVCHLYFDALGRTPDSGGFTYWTKKLNTGTPRATMAKSYLTQPESLRKVADRAYVLYLGRHGTNTELTNWATKLAKHTVSTQDIRIAVLASNEYFTRTGGTNTLYVQHMFQDVFRRAVDSSGLTYWTGQLTAGKTRTNVATRFMAEPEGRRKIVGDIYLRFLRRDPTTAEANGWVDQLAAGKTEVDVGIGLVASTEYFDRPTN